MTASAYQVAGIDPFWAYRLPGHKPDVFVYHEDGSKIAFKSKLESIPRHIFRMIVDHYSGKSNRSDIRAFQTAYQISNVIRYNSTRDIFRKATITAGMYY